MPTIADFVKNYRDAGAFQQSVHISEEFRFIYFSTPRNGCSTTKATLNLACARKLNRPLVYSTTAQIHSRVHNILKTPREIGDERFLAMIADPAVIKFCVLREPISRVCSAFSSKFRSSNSPHLRHLNERVGRPADALWDLESFAKAIASDPALRELDKHWRPQRKQISANLVDYTLMGFHNTLEPSISRFLRMVFGDGEHSIYDVRLRFPQNVSQGTTAERTLTASTRAALLEAYAEDVALYERARAAA